MRKGTRQYHKTETPWRNTHTQKKLVENQFESFDHMYVCVIRTKRNKTNVNEPETETTRTSIPREHHKTLIYKVNNKFEDSDNAETRRMVELAKQQEARTAASMGYNPYEARLMGNTVSSLSERRMDEKKTACESSTSFEMEQKKNQVGLVPCVFCVSGVLTDGCDKAKNKRL